MLYIAAWNSVALSPRLKLCPLLKLQLNPQHQDLYWSWTHLYTRLVPTLFYSGLNPFCRSHLSGNLTMTGLWYAHPGNMLTTATNSLPLLMYIHIHTCGVCSKSLRISLQLNDLLHTPQVHGHPSYHMYWFILIYTPLILQTFALQTLAIMHNNLYMFFASRTTFSLLQANGLLCGSHKQMGQYLYTVLLWILFHGFSHYTVSIEKITSAKCGIDVLLFRWFPMCETSRCS